jgi:hypothetical protein
MIRNFRTDRGGNASSHGRADSARRKKARLPVMEPLEGRVVLSTLTWTGQGMAGGSPDPGWMNPGNWNSGVAPRTGDDLVFPSNPAGGQLANTDDFPTLSVNSISFANAYTVIGGSITDPGSTSLTIAPKAGDTTTPGISVLQNGTQKLTSTIDLANLTFGVAPTDTMTINVAANNTLVLQPKINDPTPSFSGKGTMKVTGLGEFDYPVTQDMIDYAGTVLVQKGKIKVGTSKRVGKLSLSSGATLSLVQAGGGGGVQYMTGSGVLDGNLATASGDELFVDGTDPAGVIIGPDSTGSIDRITVASQFDSGGKLTQAGKLLVDSNLSTSATTVDDGGILTLQKTLTVSGAATFGNGGISPATLTVGLSGTAAGTYGELNASGAVTLTDSNLTVSPNFTVPPSQGTPFTIVQGSIINGTFANVVPITPTTGLYSSGGSSFLVSYVANSSGTVTSVQLSTLDSPTTTTLATSASPSPYGRPLTLTATVKQIAPGTGTPTGGVVFMDGTTVIGSATLNGAGVATFTTSTRAVKNHSLSAVYYGDFQDDGSTSAPLAQRIFRPVANYDGGSKTDLAIFIKSSSLFAYRPSGGVPDVTFPFGPPGQSVGITGDYDGDGTADLAVYIPSTSSIAFRPSNGSVNSLIDFGPVGLSAPVTGDYDGDGKTDLAVYISSTSTFAYRPSHGGPDVITPFGPASISEAITGDFDGDGKTDLAVYIPSTSTFAYRPSSGGPDVVVPFGPVNISIPVPGDYDGSGKTELAVYIPSTSTFAYRPAHGGPDVIIPFGPAGISEPVTGDYDGDGKTDLAVYIPSTSTFAYRPSSGGPDVIEQFGPAMVSNPLPRAATLQTSGSGSSNAVEMPAAKTSQSALSSTSATDQEPITWMTASPSPISAIMTRTARNSRRPLQTVPTVEAFDLALHSVGMRGRRSRI